MRGRIWTLFNFAPPRLYTQDKRVFVIDHVALVITPSIGVNGEKSTFPMADGIQLTFKKRGDNHEFVMC